MDQRQYEEKLEELNRQYRELIRTTREILDNLQDQVDCYKEVQSL